MADAQRAVRERIGKNIKRIRLLQGLSQEKLAGFLGRDQKYVSRLELGRVNTTLKTLTKLAGKLKVDVAEFVEPKGKRRSVLTMTRRELDQVERALRVIARARDATEARARVKRTRPKKT